MNTQLSLSNISKWFACMCEACTRPFISNNLFERNFKLISGERLFICVPKDTPNILQVYFPNSQKLIASLDLATAKAWVRYDPDTMVYPELRIGESNIRVIMRIKEDGAVEIAGKLRDRLNFAIIQARNISQKYTTRPTPKARGPQPSPIVT